MTKGREPWHMPFLPSSSRIGHLSLAPSQFKSKATGRRRKMKQGEDDDDTQQRKKEDLPPFTPLRKKEDLPPFTPFFFFLLGLLLILLLALVLALFITALPWVKGTFRRNNQRVLYFSSALAMMRLWEKEKGSSGVLLTLRYEFPHQRC